jgi:hypothetical protein
VGAELVFQAAHYLPFVFQGLRVLDAEFEGEKGNHNTVVGRQSLAKNCGYADAS